LLAFLKLWLVEGQPLYAYTWAGHDDRLYVTLAHNLLQGEWLGPYGKLTLAKGPFYPIWIAASFVAGIPLLLSQHLLYIASCFVMVMAIKPLLSRSIYLVVIFAALLFNPASFSGNVMTKVIRAGIYPALTMLVIAYALGFLTRQEDREWKKLWAWAIGLGSSMAAFWLTREEGIWLLPSLGMIAAYAIYKLWRNKPDSWLNKLYLWLTSFAIWFVLIFSVSLINLHNYGVFAKSEFDSRVFKSAYGSLTRVEPPEWKPFTLVPKRTRKEIYKVSPSFAELKPFLEGALGEFWAKNGNHTEQNQGEILGGWFVWAFRHAVAEAGYYSSGKFPREYYLRLTNEIDEACANGELECLPKRSSITPPWHRRYLKPLLVRSFQGVEFMAGFKGISPYTSISQEGFASSLFQDITRESFSGANQKLVVRGWAFSETSPISLLIAATDGTPVLSTIEFKPSMEVYNQFRAQGLDIPTARSAEFIIQTPCIEFCFLEVYSVGELLERVPLVDDGMKVDSEGLHVAIESIHTEVALPERAASDAFKTRILNNITSIYQLFTPPLALISLIGYTIYLINGAFKKKIRSTYWVITTALLVGIFVRILIFAFIDITSFPGITARYLSPIYPFLMVFVSLVIFRIIDDAVEIMSYRREAKTRISIG
jgi:hypothetical protein